MDEIWTAAGKELLFENDRVRVWDMPLAPGEESHVHKHLLDFVFIYIGPSRTTAFRDGKITNFVCEDGYVQYNTVGDRGLEPHKVKNAGDEPHRQIIVEIKGPSAAHETQPPQDNGRRVKL